MKALLILVGVLVAFSGAKQGKIICHYYVELCALGKNYQNEDKITAALLSCLRYILTLCQSLLTHNFNTADALQTSRMYVRNLFKKTCSKYIRRLWRKVQNH